MNWILFILINIFAGFFQGVIGMGHGLIATPLTLIFLPKATVFTAIFVAGCVLNSYVARQIKEPLDTKIFWPLLGGAVLGMPLGVFILHLIPKNTLLIVVGSMSIILMPIILFGKLKFHNHLKIATPVTGFFSGVLQTSTSMAGPPVGLLLSGADISKHAMRKILVTYFFAISAIAIPFLLIGHLFTLQGLLFGLSVAPFIIVAGHYGNKVAHYIPHHWYRIIALGTISITGAIAIYTGLQ